MRVGIKQTSQAVAEQLSIVHGDLVENFSAAEVVKSFGQENHESAVFQKSIELTRKAQTSQRVVHVRQKIVADLLIGLGYMIVLGYTAWLVIGGRKEWADYMGTFFLFWMCLGLIYPRVASIISEAGKFQRSLASLERVYEILDVRPTPQETKPLAKLPRIQGEVEFRDVSFSYDSDNKMILKNMSFRVPAGKTLVIAGPSGCGKSTLVNLLLRMFDPASGDILIDGTDYRHIQLDVLRQQIGVAFQECFLFNRSILENIRYARPDASIEEIEDAAKKANAHDFIFRLRNGYHTVVGEGGAVLSRGEKQRITLTRAILKEPKILILDEATASVDPDSERAILKAIEPIMQERTTLLITHRQEIISNAKYLLRIGEGPALAGAQPTYQYLDRSGQF
jgi:ABC-type multidrug transport system fused ATPase/permease subunit